MRDSSSNRTTGMAARGRMVAIALAVLALVAGVAAGCGPQAPAKRTSTAPKPTAAVYPMTVKDDAGRSVTLDAQPRCIVSLAPANTEIVAALGLTSRLAGVTTYDDYPAEVKALPKVGDFAAPNMEAVAAAKPDVVLVTGGVQAPVISKLEGLGAKVVVVDPKDVDGVMSAIGTVSAALGVPEAGERLVTSMKKDLADVAQRLGSAKPKRAFIEIGWNPLFTAGDGTLLDDLLTRAGGTNVVAQKDYVGYSVEQLVKDQPEVYLGTASSIGDPLTLEQRPGYGALKAVQAGAIYTLDDNIVSRPGPRVVEGVRAIARVLHPDLFR